ncbi:MAG: SLC13 family permease [Pirellulales bacterium]
MHLRYVTLVGGVVVGAAVFAGMRQAEAAPAQCWTASITALCACWWMFEALPLSATSLVPLVAFPLTGVLSERAAAGAYGHPTILLFMGGFMLSKAAERWEAHRRIAHATVAFIGGTSGRRIVLGIMAATALISMWISNTAIALMMLPVAMAIVERDRTGKLATPLVLGVAYAASIGGIATPIGTPPNGVFVAAYHSATGKFVPFYQWMLFGVPLAVILLIAAWVLLTFRLNQATDLDLSTNEPWTRPQKRTLVVFGLACLAWITRDIPFGGWAELIGVFKNGEGDMTVAIAATLALFLIPSGTGKAGEHLLDWPTAAAIPWGILILFGGGIAIADAFEVSGLSKLVGDQVQGMKDWNVLATTAVICFSATFLSEFTSNTATASILMPILAATAKANGLDPIVLMFPATFANNLAFMMPVGTPPNAIAYGTGYVRIGQMVRAGFVLNLVCATVVTLFCWKVLPVVFGAGN